MAGNHAFWASFHALHTAGPCSCAPARYRLWKPIAPDCEPCTLKEELASTLTHALGLTLAICGTAVLLALALLHGSSRHVITCAVYGASLIVLYASSTLYHAARHPRWKNVLRIADHTAIYLLIAGTYTPFTLISMRGPWAWTLFAAVWSLALFGVTWKILFGDRWIVISTITYLCMGWLAVIAIKPLFAMVPLPAIMWLFAGGAFYSVGVLFFAFGGRVPYAHAVWHVFVMCGSICHYIAVLLYVLPARVA